MRELHQILQLWQAAVRDHEPAVLVTVVKTQGSSYRLPGARLLLTQSGQRAGSISGGCLEDDLIRKAWWLTESGPVRRKYDTNSDGETGSGFGLGCNGVIHLLLERLLPGVPNVLDLIGQVAAERKAAVILHLVGSAAPAGQGLILDCRGNVSHNIPSLSTHQEQTLSDQAHLVQTEGTSRMVSLGGMELFCQVIAPPVKLIIVGAGDDSVPLAELAKYLGWTVSVFDGRSHYARAEKFPTNTHVIAAPVSQSIGVVSVDPWTVAVLMSHSSTQDLQALTAFKDRMPRYLGLLGPRKRTDQLILDADIESLPPDSTLHNPIGLDIGADGPEQVALAVIAEIQAVLNGRTGGQLRNQRGPIHTRNSGKDVNEVWTRAVVCR